MSKTKLKRDDQKTKLRIEDNQRLFYSME